MLPVRIVAVRFEEAADLCGADLSVFGRQGERLVARMLDGSGLVDVYMSGSGSDYSLVRTQQGGDHRDVGLGAAGQEMHRSVGQAAE